MGYFIKYMIKKPFSSPHHPGGSTILISACHSTIGIIKASHLDVFDHKIKSSDIKVNNRLEEYYSGNYNCN